MGDLNSHHPMWDKMPINFGGRLIVEKLMENDTAMILNDDASKKKDRVGFGIYIPEIDLKYSGKLPNELEICNAEIEAIHEAVDMAIKKKFENAIIFSDSSSAIRKISRTELHAKEGKDLAEVEPLKKHMTNFKTSLEKELKTRSNSSETNCENQNLDQISIIAQPDLERQNITLQYQKL
ncbi:hypothetical protein HUJ05_001780 [Dendroctonus ponderosae]|nr:hypothetical protein HUJ05_001780 [Dendroctonus ponderosae]